MLHDDKGATSVSFLESLDVSQPAGVAALLERAMKQRSVGATAMNEQSSRSHMVFMLHINGVNAGTGQKARGERWRGAGEALGDAGCVESKRGFRGACPPSK